MRALGSAALAAWCLSSAWPAVCAAAVDAGGSLALTQDDVHRGVSQTCGHPAAQADLHLRAGGAASWVAFAGAWGSAGLSGTACGSARELDLYAGYSLALTTAATVTLTYAHYAFPGGGYGNPHLFGQRYDYDQLGMSWSLADRLFLSLAWTPDALRYEHYAAAAHAEQGRRGLAYGVEYRQPVASWLSLTTAVGYDRIADPFGTGYGFWSVGFAHAGDRLEIDLAYFHTAARAVRLFGPDSAGGRVSATLLWRF